METKVLNRKEAIATGANTYYTGKPCRNKHVSFRATNSGTCLQCAEEWRMKYKGYSSAYNKQWRVDNKERIKEYRTVDNKINRKKHRDRLANYRNKNRNKINEWAKEYSKRRRRNDPVFNMANRIRGIVKKTLLVTGQRKQKTSHKYLGYTAIQLKEHIESNFLEGMGWHNRSEWHIDHIKPINAFIKEGVTDVKVINALKNLQPLWARDNIAKGAKWNESRKMKIEL